METVLTLFALAALFVVATCGGGVIVCVVYWLTASTKEVDGIRFCTSCGRNAGPEKYCRACGGVNFKALSGYDPDAIR